MTVSVVRKVSVMGIAKAPTINDVDVLLELVETEDAIFGLLEVLYVPK